MEWNDSNLSVLKIESNRRVHWSLSK